MSIDKNRRSGKSGSGRDAGGFVALPWSVLDCDAYKKLSYPARSLLVEFARQYSKYNNGRLLGSHRYLKARGWRSNDVIHRAKQQLIDGGFLFQTVQGHRPNKASWYAITWQSRDKIAGYDPGTMDRWIDYRSAYKNSKKGIRALNPRDNLKDPSIDPPRGVSSITPYPRDGSIMGNISHQPTPQNGDHLELPSTVVLMVSSVHHSAANNTHFCTQNVVG